MKDMQTVFDDLTWLYHEDANVYLQRAVDQLDALAGVLRAPGELVNTPRLTAELLNATASAQASIACSLAHVVGLLEVIAQNVVVRP